MATTFIEVQVEEHEALPEGCCLRFKAQDEGRAVTRVTWESEEGIAGIWSVEAAMSDGSRQPATAFLVDDSSAGTSLLIVGGDHGLRLTSIESGATASEPYLLVSRDALVKNNRATGRPRDIVDADALEGAT